MLRGRVTSYNGETITFKDGSTMDSSTVIWAAGVKGSIIPGLEAAVDPKANRYKVDRFNKLQGIADVYALGDVAFMQEGNWEYGHPQVAPAAIQQAELLVRNLINQAEGRPMKEFTYVDNLTDPKKTRDLARAVALQYIELPLTIKLMTNEIGYMRYFAVVGAGNAFNVKAKGDKVEPKVIANRPDEDKTPVVEKFEELEKEGMQDDIALYKASLIVGAGAEYNFSGSTSLMFGVTYNNGFTNILDIDGMKAKAHYVELSLGVFF